MTRAPSTIRRPSSTVADPPVLQTADDQPSGSVVPENSTADTGASTSSPSALSATCVVVAVPALKSTLVVSCSVGCGVVKSRGNGWTPGPGCGVPGGGHV